MATTQNAPTASSAAQMGHLAPGTVLGERFEIEGLVGEGAMGIVYRAKDRSGDRPAAVKVLKRQLVQSKEFVTRFKREARAASRFRHEAAVRVLTTGETDDKLPWIAMELIEGKSLKEILEQETSLPPGRACNLAQQLLRGLGSAHRAGIVHRDMKPDNIRVVRDADGIERPKILDFGVAKFVRGDVGDVSGSFKTKTGVVLGTPKYMSPEQIRGDVVDGRADIYAVGAMLYEMLCGKPPFEATDVFGFVAMHLKETVPPITQRFPELDVPAEVDVAVLRMLEKDPNARPSDAGALADEIAKFAVEDPTAGAKSAQLRKGAAIVAAAGVVGAVATFFVAPSLAPAAAPASLALGIGAAIAARKFGRPSVYSFLKRCAVVAGIAALLGAVAVFVPGSPGFVPVVGFALSALLVYAAFLLVWNSKAVFLRVVAAGLAAPFLAFLLFPVQVRVKTPDAEPYYVDPPGVLSEAADDQAKIDIEKDAKNESLIALLAISLVFGLASTALPRPGAARLS